MRNELTTFLIAVLVVCVLRPVRAELWGKAVEGVQAGIVVDRKNLGLGDEFTVTTRVRNTSTRTIRIFYPGEYGAQQLAVRGPDGKDVKWQPTAKYKSAGRAFFRVLKPGEVFTEQHRFTVALGYAMVNFNHVADRSVLLNTSDSQFDIGQISLGKTEKIALRLVLDERMKDLKHFEDPNDSAHKAPLFIGPVSSNEVVVHVRRVTRRELDGFVNDLNSGSVEQKRRALGSLETNADLKAVPVLMRMLKSCDPQLLPAVASALKFIRDASTIPELKAIFSSTESGEIRSAVIDVLTRLAPYDALVTEQRLLAFRSATSWEAKGRFIFAFGYYNNIEAIPDLLQAAAGADSPVIQQSAIDALGWIGERLPAERKPELVEPLIKIMKADPDVTVRGRAATELGHIGDPSAGPALVEALRDPGPSVGAEAANALSKIGGPEAIKALEEYIARAQTDYQIRAAKMAIENIKARSQMK